MITSPFLNEDVQKIVPVVFSKFVLTQVRILGYLSCQGLLEKRPYFL